MRKKTEERRSQAKKLNALSEVTKFVLNLMYATQDQYKALVKQMADKKRKKSDEKAHKDYITDISHAKSQQLPKPKDFDLAKLIKEGIDSINGIFAQMNAKITTVVNKAILKVIGQAGHPVTPQQQQILHQVASNALGISLSMPLVASTAQSSVSASSAVVPTPSSTTQHRAHPQSLLITPQPTPIPMPIAQLFNDDEEDIFTHVHESMHASLKQDRDTARSQEGLQNSPEKMRMMLQTIERFRWGCALQDALAGMHRDRDYQKTLGLLQNLCNEIIPQLVEMKLKNQNELSRILSPIIARQSGADVVSGLISSGLFQKRGEPQTHSAPATPTLRSR